MEYKRNTSLKPSEQMISAYPDIIKREIKSSDDFIVMGCDGIWEIQTEIEICEFLEQKLKSMKEKKISPIVEDLLMRCLAPNTTKGLGCDNMSSIVIQFKK